MGILNDLLKGAIALSILALLEHGVSVKDMAIKAADIHKKGLTSYGEYSRILTGEQASWLNYKK